MSVQDLYIMNFVKDGGFFLMVVFLSFSLQQCCAVLKEKS